MYKHTKHGDMNTRNDVTPLLLALSWVAVGVGQTLATIGELCAHGSLACAAIARSLAPRDTAGTDRDFPGVTHVDRGRRSGGAR